MPDTGLRAVLILSETVFSYFLDWNIIEFVRRIKHLLSEHGGLTHPEAVAGVFGG